MRIAICFSGQLRTAVHAAPFILKWIGSLKDNCDFFIHTWDVNNYPGYGSRFTDCVKYLTGYELVPSDHIRKQFPIDPNDIEYLKKIYKPKAFLIDDYQSTHNYWAEYWVQNYFKQHNLKYDFGHYFIPLYYSFYKSIELKKEYEIQNNFKYDLVFKIRPDTSYPIDHDTTVVFSDNINNYVFQPTSIVDEVDLFFKHDNKHKFFCISGSDTAFGYGSSEVMDIASQHWLTNLTEWNINMGEYCEKKNIPITRCYNTTLAFHRILGTGIPIYDWAFNYILESMCNDPYFCNRIQTGMLTKSSRMRLGDALINHKVVDIYSEIYGLPYTIDHDLRSKILSSNV